MSLENIKDKIKKLLALSEGTTHQEESYTALMKAQELMAKYKLEAEDIKDNQKEQKCVQKKTILSYGTRSSDHYLDDLASVIAENFCCINYISTPRGTRTHYISFMGNEDDVEIATEVLYVANRNIISGYNRVYKDICKEYNVSYVPAKFFNPRKVGYIRGYLKGLKEALESQKEQNQEWGLVLVVPEEAKNFMSSLNEVDFNNPIAVSDRYYDQGYEDGTKFHLNDKIENKIKQDMLSE